MAISLVDICLRKTGENMYVYIYIYIYTYVHCSISEVYLIIEYN